MATRSSSRINIYLETGKKRIFAGALDWPGWCRSGRDETSALQALLDYAPRYRRALQAARVDFQAPAHLSAFVLKERLEGNATTDFGAPGAIPAADAKPLNALELKRLDKVLEGCWQTFDEVLRDARGKSLRTGPRGGGRQVEEIVQHLLESDAAYLGQSGWKLKRDQAAGLPLQLQVTRQAILDALAASAHGEIPEKGPRGGLRWRPRYFVRRVAWHTLDHAWEIEDRLS